MTFLPCYHLWGLGRVVDIQCYPTDRRSTHVKHNTHPPQIVLEELNPDLLILLVKVVNTHPPQTRCIRVYSKSFKLSVLLKKIHIIDRNRI